MTPADESPNPNPIPGVDTRYTGTPDDAIDAEYENEEDRGNRIDLQPTNTPARGGGGSRSRVRKKKQPQLTSACTTCGKRYPPSVKVCTPPCAGDVVAVKAKRGRKIDGRNATGYKTHPAADTIAVFKRVGNPGRYLDAVAPIAEIATAADIRDHFLAVMAIANDWAIPFSGITKMLEAVYQEQQRMDNTAA